MDDPHRAIKAIYDRRTETTVSAEAFFGQPEWRFHLERREEHQEAQRDPIFLCYMCGYPVFARKGPGVPHFAHRKGSETDCPWHTEPLLSIDEVGARKFQGAQESPLHESLKNLIADMLREDPLASSIQVERRAVSGDLHSTRPDVLASIGSHLVAFELQLATTLIADIERRESYNAEHGIYTLWIFHEFERFRHYASAKDIYVPNSFNAFELNYESIDVSKREKRLVLRCWWRQPVAGKARDTYPWRNTLIGLEELIWSPTRGAVYFFDFLAEEAKEMRRANLEFLENFERLWRERNSGRGDIWEYQRRVGERAFVQFRHILGEICRVDWRTALEFKFDRTLDRLFALKDGRSDSVKQELKGRVATILENWPGYTEAAVAIAESYGRNEILNWDKFAKAVKLNLKGGPNSGPVPQHRDFNPILRLLFPEAASRLPD